MSRRRLEKQVGAYRDGALSEREAAALRQRLASDPEAALELARHEALGRLAREAWREGPAAPSPEMLIAALRPGMTRIDAELEDSRTARWRGWLTPVPLFALGTAAAVLALAILPPGSLRGPGERSAPQVIARADPSTLPVTSEPPAAAGEQPDQIPVYDLTQGDSPLVVFEDGGTTFIWLIEPVKPSDDLSSLPAARAGVV
jgi:anti-sigma factor RsiW